MPTISQIIDQASEMALSLDDLAVDRKGDVERGLLAARDAARAIADELERIQGRFNLSSDARRRAAARRQAAEAEKAAYKARWPRVSKHAAARQFRELLEAYGQCGKITEAAKRVGMAVTRHYYAMDNNPDYAAAFAKVRATVEQRTPPPKKSKADRIAAMHRGAASRKKVERAKAAFLDAFAKARSVLGAQRLCGVRYQAHVKWLTRDRDYRAAFDRLLCGVASAGRAA